MLGIIWFVQLVHYPLFPKADLNNFKNINDEQIKKFRNQYYEDLFSHVKNKDNSKKEPEIQKKTSENTLVKQKTEKIFTTDERWLTVCEKLKRSIGKKYNLGSLLRTAQNPSPENSILTLKFKSKTLTENMTEEIKDQKVKNLIESTVSDVYNETITIKIISNNSSDNNGSDTKIEDSPIVRMAITMGGKVINKKDNK